MPGRCPRVRPIIIALIAVTALLAQTRWASACACCDGHTKRQPLGWKNDQLVVRMSRMRACEPSEALEMYRATRATPAICFDLLNRGRQTSCDELRAQWHVKPAATPQALSKPSKLESVAPRNRRARLVHVGTAAFGHDLHVLEVEVRAGKSWHRIHRSKRIPYTDGSPVDHMDPAVEKEGVRVAVLPQPGNAKRALLFIDGIETAPGIGHDDSVFVPVQLPKKLPTVKRYRPVLAVPTPRGTGVSSKAGTPEATLNARGLADHRSGKYLDAARAFTRALMWNDRHVLARYNLACALARLGYPERALEQLKLTIESAPAHVAAERRKRARSDADLRTLRHLKSFRELTRDR